MKSEKHRGGFSIWTSLHALDLLWI